MNRINEDGIIFARPHDPRIRRAGDPGAAAHHPCGPGSPSASPRLRAGARGVSLVEMLAVVFIIGVILAMGIPSGQRMLRESAVRADAVELCRTFQLAQRLAVVYQRPHVVVFNTEDPSTGEWDPTGEHHWYTLLGPKENGGGASSGDYYCGEIVDPDGIQIGPHHYLRAGVRFWRRHETDFDESKPWNEHIPGFSTASGTGYSSSFDMRMGSDPSNAYTDFKNGAWYDTRAVFAMPNYQFSRADCTNTGATTIYSGLVHTSDVSIRRVLTMEENTGRTTVAVDARVAW